MRPSREQLPGKCDTVKDSKSYTVLRSVGFLTNQSREYTGNSVEIAEKLQLKET